MRYVPVMKMQLNKLMPSRGESNLVLMVYKLLNTDLTQPVR